MRNVSIPSTSHAPARHQGVTLVEVVVALLLVASCTIGIATIYAQRQNIARGGRLHEHAIELAQQLAATIRDNSDGKRNFETRLGNTCKTPPKESTDKLNAQLQANGSSAANTVACWQDRVEQELTNGSATISLDRNTVPAQYIIVVSWSEPRSGTASYVLRVTPGSGKPETPATTDAAARAAG